MPTGTRARLRLGDLVAAAFDEAATRSTDPQVVLRLVTLTVNDLLRWAPQTSTERTSTVDRRRSGDPVEQAPR